MEANNGTVLAGAGAVGVIVGSIGPWASVATGFGTISVNGTQGDGTLNLVLVSRGALVADRVKVWRDDATQGLLYPYSSLKVRGSRWMLQPR